MSSFDGLTAISPLDGRYRKAVQGLADKVSQFGLISYRVRMECAYLLALSFEKGIPLTLTLKEKVLLRKISNVSLEDAKIIEAIEKEGYGDIPATNHDVKAVEYFLRGKFKGTTLEKKISWIHFGLTSEDVNNIAYALMIRDAVYESLDILLSLLSELRTLSATYAASPMLARTHGQSASPTTFGKEIRVFEERLKRQHAQLQHVSILAKLNGATGNYNAHAVAFPSVNWVKFSEKFIASFNAPKDTILLKSNRYTTQIEPHDSWVEVFHIMSRTNTILIDFAQDMWRYISDGWVKQKTKAGEVGSSAMPHKVNPIDFENAEGNLGMANALFGFFAAKLPISRLQRDLSDSTVERNIGPAFAHTIVGVSSLLRGLSKIIPDATVMKDVVNAHPEVLAEAIQTILRREGLAEAYEALKDVTRGHDITLEDLRMFIEGLPISTRVKRELLQLEPSLYTGIASKLA